MPKIPEVLHAHINEAFPKNVCLVGALLSNGYSQISPRGSVIVYDDETLAFWDRGSGGTHDAVQDGTQLTIYYRNMERRSDGTLPKGGIARFYGRAKLYEDGPVRDEVYERMVQPERDRDPEKQGIAVLVKLEFAEDLSGDPLNI